LRELKKEFEESQKSEQLPRPNVESVEDIIARPNDLDIFSDPLMENSKILLIEDPRSFDSLKESFPQFPSELITQIWIMQETWGACFDILSSLRASGHQSVTFTFIFDPIADPTSWPTLQTAYPRRIKCIPRTRSNSDRSILLLHHSDAEFYQDVISLSNSSLSGFSWQVCSEKKDDDDVKSIASEASWEILQDDEKDEEDHSNSYPRTSSEHLAPSPLTPGLAPKSYREALLTKAFDFPDIPTSDHQATSHFGELTQIFPKNLGSSPGYTGPIHLLQFDELIDESDTYEDWLESNYGSKETSIAAINRARVHCAKVSHERKRKWTNNYSRKHAR
jgi:hypothetical protein